MWREIFRVYAGGNFFGEYQIGGGNFIGEYQVGGENFIRK